MPATRTSASAAHRRRHVALLLAGAASVFVVLEPWHGPMVLALSEQHGVDAADLPAIPLIALALVASRSRARERGRLLAGSAVVLGALLMAGLLYPRIGSPLVPTGGGTLGRTTQHVDGRRAEAVGRWTHLAVTYDGATYRLYVDGREASSRSASGAIRSTTDPLWIGGNRPYGEYFQGVIDEVRIYRRPLKPSEVRAAMTTPVARRVGPNAEGLVAAYAFDAGRGRTATDASGKGNTGRIRGARWTTDGRFGAGMRFDGAGEVVRVPASASLNLRTAMTLMAWISPSRSQSGWRTVLARQTDAYFLTAGGGREDADVVERLDRLRFLLVVLLVASIGWALARGQSPWADGRWYRPVALFVAGSLLDVAFAPSDTLIGPALVASWWAVTSSQRVERVTLGILAAVFAAATVISLVDQAQLPLPQDDGGVVRAAGLGLLLAAAGLRKNRPPSAVR